MLTSIWTTMARTYFRQCMHFIRHKIAKKGQYNIWSRGLMSHIHSHGKSQIISQMMVWQQQQQRRQHQQQRNSFNSNTWQSVKSTWTTLQLLFEFDKVALITIVSSSSTLYTIKTSIQNDKSKKGCGEYIHYIRYLKSLS